MIIFELWIERLLFNVVISHLSSNSIVLFSITNRRPITSKVKSQPVRPTNVSSKSPNMQPNWKTMTKQFPSMKVLLAHVWIVLCWNTVLRSTFSVLLCVICVLIYWIVNMPLKNMQDSIQHSRTHENTNFWMWVKLFSVFCRFILLFSSFWKGFSIDFWKFEKKLEPSWMIQELFSFLSFVLNFSRLQISRNSHQFLSIFKKLAVNSHFIFTC